MISSQNSSRQLFTYVQFNQLENSNQKDSAESKTMKNKGRANLTTQLNKVEHQLDQENI